MILDGSVTVISSTECCGRHCNTYKLAPIQVRPVTQDQRPLHLTGVLYNVAEVRAKVLMSDTAPVSRLCPQMAQRLRRIYIVYPHASTFRPRRPAFYHIIKAHQPRVYRQFFLCSQPSLSGTQLNFIIMLFVTK